MWPFRKKQPALKAEQEISEMQDRIRRNLAPISEGRRSELRVITDSDEQKEQEIKAKLEELKKSYAPATLGKMMEIILPLYEINEEFSKKLGELNEKMGGVDQKNDARADGFAEVIRMFKKRLEGVKAELKESIEGMKVEIKEESEEYAKKYYETGNRVSEIAQKESSLRETVESHKKIIDGHEESLGKISSDIEGKSSETKAAIEAVKQEISNLQNSDGELKEIISKLQQDIDSLEHEVGPRLGEMDERLKIIRTFQGRMDKAIEVLQLSDKLHEMMAVENNGLKQALFTSMQDWKKARIEIIAIRDLLEEVVSSKGLPPEVIRPYIEARITEKIGNELGYLVDLIDRKQMSSEITEEAVKRMSPPPVPGMRNGSKY